MTNLRQSDIVYALFEYRNLNFCPFRSTMSTFQRDYQNFELPYQNTGFGAELAHTGESRQGGKCCFFGCCLGCLGFLLLIFLLLVGCYYCCFTGGTPLEVSPETSVITEPLKSDGKTVDFHQAIQKLIEPEIIQANENGFRDVLLAFGQAMFENDWQYRKTCEHFGIDPQTPPQFALENPRRANVRFDNESLNAVQAAVAKPHYSIPLVRRNESDLVLTSLPAAVQKFHEQLKSAFRDRAAARFKEGDNVAEAWKDILTAVRLARFVVLRPTYQSAHLDALDDESRLTPVADIIAVLPKWTPEQLEQAVKDLESLPNWKDRQTTLQIMQFICLDLLSATDDFGNLAARLGLQKEDRDVLMALQIIAFDWNLVAKAMNSEFKAYGELIDQAEGKSLEEQFELLSLRQPGERHDLHPNEERLQEKIEELLLDRIETGEGWNILFTPVRSKLTGALAGRLFVSWAAGEMYRLQLMEEAHCQALRLAFALELYRREHQTYPDSLEELRLNPMTPNIDFEYEKFGERYRLYNKAFQLEK